MSGARQPYVQTDHDIARRSRVYCDYPGSFAIRQSKGGVEVSLRITHQPSADPATGEINWERPYVWIYEVNGSVVYEDMLPNPRLYIGREIDAVEFKFLLADRQWAASYAPGLPEAQPDKKIDISKLPLPF